MALKTTMTRHLFTRHYNEGFTYYYSKNIFEGFVNEAKCNINLRFEITLHTENNRNRLLKASYQAEVMKIAEQTLAIYCSQRAHCGSKSVEVDRVSSSIYTSEMQKGICKL